MNKKRFHIICAAPLGVEPASISLHLLPALGCMQRARQGAIPGWGRTKRRVRRRRSGGGSELRDRCDLHNCQPISHLFPDPNSAVTNPSALLLRGAGGFRPDQRTTIFQKPIIDIIIYQSDGGRPVRPSSTRGSHPLTNGNGER